jgi:DTW domain-containing protein YfiP
MSGAVRPTCQRCLRPTAFCACGAVPAVPSRTRVVILQHPREARLAICSARATRLALENAELHRGVDFEDDPRVRALAATPGAAVLFPGADAIRADACAPPPVLFAVDGTWHQAEKMLRVNPRLAALPRIRVVPEAPSGYGDLRREPAEGHLPTIEAVALALGALERDPSRFAPMVAAFRENVARQLACARGATRRPRHRPARPG